LFRNWDPDQAAHFSKGDSIQNGAVVEAILQRYLSDKGARVYDACAGYLTRGFVCAVNGCSYDGWDIWPELIAENNTFVKQLGLKNVRYHVGDARKLDGAQGECDLAFFSPPYWHLEEYSGLSECLAECREFKGFLDAVGQCATALFGKVRTDGFVAAIVSDVRDKDGWLLDIIGQTITKFELAGFRYHDRIVLVHPPGTGALTAENSWRGRKLVNRPEMVLLFKKPHVKLTAKVMKQ
jgi:hypothetical protein